MVTRPPTVFGGAEALLEGQYGPPEAMACVTVGVGAGVIASAVGVEVAAAVAATMGMRVAGAAVGIEAGAAVGVAAGRGVWVAVGLGDGAEAVDVVAAGATGIPSPLPPVEIRIPAPPSASPAIPSAANP
jgi:hypothetical protein